MIQRNSITESSRSGDTDTLLTVNNLGLLAEDTVDELVYPNTVAYKNCVHGQGIPKHPANTQPHHTCQGRFGPRLQLGSVTRAAHTRAHTQPESWRVCACTHAASMMMSASTPGCYTLPAQSLPRRLLVRATRGIRRTCGTVNDL